MTTSAEQVFVILRADAYEENDTVVEHATVKKVVLDAKSEGDRLNSLNAENGCRSLIEVARVDRGALLDRH